MTTRKIINLKEYNNQWVALTKNGRKVIASNDDIKITLKQARKIKKDGFIIVQAPALSGSYIL